MTDNCPGAPAPVCVPASGSFFPIGVTTVTCSVGGTSCVSKTITHSSSQAITPLNSVSCNDGIGHTDNHYWRAFNLPSFSVTGTFHVSSIDLGIEEATAGSPPVTSGTKGIKRSSNRAERQKAKGARPNGAAAQPITVLLHTNTGGAFPGGTLNFLNSVNINVPDQSGTVLNIPITADVPAGSELVVEIFTPDGTATGNLFFIGSNTAAETGPSYLSAPDCGITTPTTTAAIGFPDMHIVMNVNGCEDTTGGPTSSCNFTVTVKAPHYWSTVGSAGTADEDSLSLVSQEDFAVKLKDGLTGTATVRYNITAVQGISAYCPATDSVVYVRFRNSDNAGTHAQVKFEIHRTSILNGGNDILFTFNSNGLGAGNVFTSASLAPNIDFDFSNYIYWVEATVFRDQAGQFADLGAVGSSKTAAHPVRSCLNGVPPARAFFASALALLLWRSTSRQILLTLHRKPIDFGRFSSSTSRHLISVSVIWTDRVPANRNVNPFRLHFDEPLWRGVSQNPAPAVRRAIVSDPLASLKSRLKIH